MEKIIIATNETIYDTIVSEIKRLGNNADLNHIDVSNVTNIRCMFQNSQFNGDISKWNVSNVIDMYRTFSGSKFNGDISKWDVSSVADIDFMFSNSIFNGDISNWNINSITNIFCAFNNCPIREEYKPKFKEKINAKLYGNDICTLMDDVGIRIY